MRKSYITEPSDAYRVREWIHKRVNQSAHGRVRFTSHKIAQSLGIDVKIVAAAVCSMKVRYGSVRELGKVPGPAERQVTRYEATRSSIVAHDQLRKHSKPVFDGEHAHTKVIRSSTYGRKSVPDQLSLNFAGAARKAPDVQPMLNEAVALLGKVQEILKRQG